MYADRSYRHLLFLQDFLGRDLDSPDALHHALVDAAEHLMPSSERHLWRYDPYAQEFTMLASNPEVRAFIVRIPEQDTYSGLAIRKGEPLYFSNILEEASMFVNKEYARQHNLASLWVLPIFLRRDAKRVPYGTLIFYPVEDATITLGHEEIELLTSLTRIIEQHSPALDRERMADELKLGLGPEETFPQFWDRVAKSIADQLGFDTCTLFVADPAEEHVRKVGGYGHDIEREAREAVFGKVVEYKKGLDATGYTLEKRGTVYSQNVYIEPWSTGSTEGAHKRSGVTYLATPIWEIPGGRIIGLVRCTDKRRTVAPEGEESIVQDDLARIESVAKELSPIIQHYVYAEQNRVLWALASHDLRAPTNAIRGAAGTFLKRTKSQQVQDRKSIVISRTCYKSYSKQVLEEIREAVDTILKKTEPEDGYKDDLLLISGTDRKRFENILDNTNLLHLLVDMLATGAEEEITYDFERDSMLSSLLARIVALVRPAAMNKNIQVFYERFDDLPKLYIDRRRIEIAFYNVLINAIKYSYKDTAIKIHWTAKNEHYLIHVTNEGIGVPEDDRENIFRPFFRASNAEKSVTAGKGLGLFIVRRIMHAHGGDICLTRLHAPTIFTLKLPATLTYGKPK